MKTHLVTTYTLEELSQEAQQTAHENYLNSGNFEYFWLDEALDSAREFCDLFGVKITDYLLSTWGNSFIRTNAENSHFRGYKPSDFKERDLTGYCADYSLFFGANEYLKEKPGDIKGAFNAALDEWLNNVVRDMESQEGFEYFKDMAISNEWQYLESGKMY